MLGEVVNLEIGLSLWLQFIASLWFRLKLKNGLISSLVSFQLLKHTPTFSPTFFFSCTTVVFQDNFLSIVAWFMRWLIRHNHKLGKMFSAPSHAVRGRACDLEHVDLLLLWREEEVRIEVGRLWHGSVENVKALEEVERFFLFFKVYFSTCWGLVRRFQLNMMDQTSWKINT